MNTPYPRWTLLCAALFVLPAAALAQAPVLLAKSANGESLFYSPLDVAGTVKSVRTSLVYTTAHTVGDLKNVLSSVALEQIDCLHLTRSTTHVDLYDNPDARGTPLWSKDFTSTERPPLAVEPSASTASSILYRAVCLSPTTTTTTTTTTTSTTTTNAPVARPSSALTVASAPTAPAATSPTPPTAPVAATPPAAVTAASTATAAVPTPAPAPQPVPQTAVALPPDPVPMDSAGSIAPTVSTGSMDEVRPVPGLTMTLGTMGKFAEYVYFNEEDLGVLSDTFAKIQRGRAQIARDGRAHPLVDEAFKRIELKASQYNDKLHEKNNFLSAGEFRALALPKARQGVVKGFRAELYQHVPTGEKILVFRGTDSALDWLTNLWTGVDLLAIEAPHYQAAYSLVAALRKRGDAPLVVGHSLGGGMAQYVGFKFGLKVVGFNSAPLPERYFLEGEGAKLDQIRLFSAVEYPEQPGPTPSPGFPDPVSIRVANAASNVNRVFSDYEPLKAHQLLTKPVCVKSIPNPFYTESERQFHHAMANKAVSRGMVSVVAGGFLPRVKPIVADLAIAAEIRRTVNAGLSDPVWLPDSKSRRDTEIAQDVRDEVAEVAVEQYKAIGGSAALMKGGYKVALGNSWGDIFAGAGSLAAAGAKVVAMDMLITQLLQPHSMERLNRGLRNVSAEEVFSAAPPAADCETTVSARYH